MSHSLSTITLSIGAPLALLAYAVLDGGEPPKPPQRLVPTVSFAELVVTEATIEHGALIRLSGAARAITVLGPERTAAFSCKVSPRPDTVARVRIVGDACIVK